MGRAGVAVSLKQLGAIRDTLQIAGPELTRAHLYLDVGSVEEFGAAVNELLRLNFDAVKQRQRRYDYALQRWTIVAEYVRDGVGVYLRCPSAGRVAA